MNPLVPANVDLRDFRFMPLDCLRLRDSDLAAVCSGDEFRAAVLLWCASWHQLPAASLPDDDAVLSQLAGYGRVVKEWKKVRSGAMRGWVKCDDGRLYHPVVAEKANEAWIAKLEQRWRTECARIKKHAQRHKMLYTLPTFEEWMSQDCPQGHPTTVPWDKSDGVPGDIPQLSPDCPSGNTIQGTGIGTGNIKEIDKSISILSEQKKSHFEEFWEAYPNKTGKKPCLDKWKRRKLDEKAEAIIADVRQKAARDTRWLDGFIPNPETYLNQDRWNDPIQIGNRDGPKISRTANADDDLQNLLRSAI